MKAKPPKEKPGSLLVGLPIPSSTPKTRATAEAWGKEHHSCKPLPKEFRRDGFEYRQIAREGNGAIYEQRWTGCAEASVCYEVIRVKRREGFHIGGRWVPPAEVYPRSEQWGELGWTVKEKEAAFRKLRQIASPEIGAKSC